MRTFVYSLVFFTLLQLAIPRVVQEHWIHDYRVEYNTVKNNMAADLGVAMDRIAADIRRNPARDYVILLGDSVTYSGPGGPEQSIGRYLADWSRRTGRPLQVYNLAQPGMMGGDTYTEILMLKERGIPVDRVVINQIYAHYAPMAPNEAAFGWLGEELRRLDPAAWAEANGTTSVPRTWTMKLREQMLAGLPLWQYRDFLRQELHLTTTREVRDIRPWTEKRAWLESLMREPIYQRFVEPRPVELSRANPHVAMLERIIQATDGKAQFWFSPANHGLLTGTSDPGYRANLQRIDQWFSAHRVTYVNLENAIPADLFTDHVHLVPAGYEQLAVMLGEWLTGRRQG